MVALLLRLASCAAMGAGAFHASMLASSRLAITTRARQKLGVEDILRDRTLCFMMFCAAGLVIAFATTPWVLPVCIVIAYVLAKRAPTMLDARAARELRSACDEQVDVMADIVAMGVKSGLSFDAALDLYCEKFDNELARQLARTRMEWKGGLASRNEALQALATRVNSRAVKRFADTSLQAIHYGSPLASMLGRYSADIRLRRREAIERQIAKAPVKLLIPTGTCILPAMLILVMGPVLLQFIQTGF